MIKDNLSFIKNGEYLALWIGYSMYILFKNGNKSERITSCYKTNEITLVVVTVNNGKGEMLSGHPEDIERVYKTYNSLPDGYVNILGIVTDR